MREANLVGHDTAEEIDRSKRRPGLRGTGRQYEPHYFHSSFCH